MRLLGADMAMHVTAEVRVDDEENDRDKVAKSNVNNQG